MSKIVLGIETSCDETAASVVVDGREIKSNVIYSQIDIHKLYGGVVPEIASRNHVEVIDVVVAKALSDANITILDVDAIGVTYGAGLVGALLVGVSYAKALSQISGKPLYAVNHIQGHICANYLSHNELQPPYICLLVSGGHTSIVKVVGYTEYEMLFSTVDDAIGEAFDKVARVMGLCYPGGVQIDKLAKDGQNNIQLPSSVLKNGDFSYSGLKTAVVNYIHTHSQKGEQINKSDVACSFTHAAMDDLIDKAIQCAVYSGCDKIAVAGGVGANSYLRNTLTSRAPKGFTVLLPDKILCTDNAAMIASQAYFNMMSGQQVADSKLNAMPTLKLRADRPHK